MRRPTPDPARPGQESAWTYPRPPRAERTQRRIQVILGGITVADTTRAVRVLETSHAPVYYIPPDDVREDLLSPAPGASYCEWKGEARYFDARAGGRHAARAAWRYDAPRASFESIAGHYAFYAAPMDACLVDGERVTPQPGGFYGGWITRDVAGPFKGGPGTSGW